MHSGSGDIIFQQTRGLWQCGCHCEGHLLAVAIAESFVVIVEIVVLLSSVRHKRSLAADGHGTVRMSAFFNMNEGHR